MTAIMRATRLAFDSIVEKNQSAIESTCAAISLEARQGLMEQFGDFTLAYSACHQDGLKYFGDDRGFLAFGQKMGHTFVLGDPICEPANRTDLLKNFLSRFEKKIPSFVQVGSGTAEELNALGFRINQMGVDTAIDLSNYSFAGKRRERFRYAHNWLNKNGYRIEEMTFADFGRPRIRRLSVQWRRTRTVRKREVSFINRPMVYSDELDTRKFILLDPDDTPVAFAGFDPIYRLGQVIGYVTTFKRRAPFAPRYSELGMMKAIIEMFIEEGRSCLRLGLSPLAQISDVPWRTNRRLKWMLSQAYQTKWLNRRYYNVQGHAEYKKRFGGKEEPLFYASPVAFNSARMIALIRLCKLV